jgi:MOSC domain-containing protein YiiM
VAVGIPRQVEVPGGTVLTSIFKEPVASRVAVRAHNIEGDRQADLSVHGGPHKAIYAYPAEHYAYWRAQLPDHVLVPGNFGENLTTDGLLEEAVRIGDRYRVGSAVLQVTQPRMPCYKLGIRFGMTDMVRRFWLSGRPGIYFSIAEEGDLGAGDVIETVWENAEGITVADVVELYRGTKTDHDLLQRALRAPLPGGWKTGLLERQQSLGRV